MKVGREEAAAAANALRVRAGMPDLPSDLQTLVDDTPAGRLLSEYLGTNKEAPLRRASIALTHASAKDLKIVPLDGPTEHELNLSTRGLYRDGLKAMLKYFPDGLLGEPSITDADQKWYLFNDVGVCLVGLGRLEEAIAFYEKNTAAYEAYRRAGEEGDPPEQTGPRSSYLNLAEAYLHLGNLDKTVECAQLAQKLAIATDSTDFERDACIIEGIAWHRLGVDAGTDAARCFARADEIGGASDIWAIYRAEYAHDSRIDPGNEELARELLHAVVDSEESAPHVKAQALGVLARVEPKEALDHFQRAFQELRSVQAELVKTELLYRRGSFFSASNAGAMAIEDLELALRRASISGMSEMVELVNLLLPP